MGQKKEGKEERSMALLQQKMPCNYGTSTEDHRLVMFHREGMCGVDTLVHTRQAPSEG